MTTPRADSSPSLKQGTHWWYRVRSDLLEVMFAKSLLRADVILDVGSADAPSLSWLPDRDRVVSVDIDLAALGPNSVCADASRLPFSDRTFGAVTAFDVVEHFESEDLIIRELTRVLQPAGVLCVSVPAYQWAWTGFDVAQGHYRRYTRQRLVAAMERHGLQVVRLTHAFASMFPAFAGARLMDRARKPAPSSHMPASGRMADLMMTRLGKVDARLLEERDLPFGSSIFAEAVRP